MKMYLISDNIDTYTGMRLARCGRCDRPHDELKEALERTIATKRLESYS